STALRPRVSANPFAMSTPPARHPSIGTRRRKARRGQRSVQAESALTRLGERRDPAELRGRTRAYGRPGLVRRAVLARGHQAVLRRVRPHHRVGLGAIEGAAPAGRTVLEHLEAAEIVAEALVGAVEGLALPPRGGAQDL